MKDRGLICRIAGNVVGATLAKAVEDQARLGSSAVPSEVLDGIAEIGVEIALRIVAKVDGDGKDSSNGGDHHGRD